MSRPSQDDGHAVTNNNNPLIQQRVYTMNAESPSKKKKKGKRLHFKEWLEQQDDSRIS
tara:strand:- start:1283 stop:1456 length:174 start_codon:yes stop_codon:yes gene_type:complete